MSLLIRDVARDFVSASRVKGGLRGIERSLQVKKSLGFRGHPIDHEASDRPILLRGGRADHMGKGATGLRSLQRKHEPDKEDR